ncbi:hypothetical protein FNV43_RR10286 [Rhamnella rubrinervis]|uniref:Uncharacterized protein n=1 Tax=Rhamnella rubrinervis TaxID=2594499 RepID=A0A8K0MKQ8_9ROSA|nr:hypothetical protein FNV43_RR10286 [Rhamnella rubrinervis]
MVLEREEEEGGKGRLVLQAFQEENQRELQEVRWKLWSIAFQQLGGGFCLAFSRL